MKVLLVLASILQSMGMPIVGLGMILGVDRILDMARTAVNVTGDLTACTVMERWLGPPASPKNGVQRRAAASTNQ